MPAFQQPGVVHFLYHPFATTLSLTAATLSPAAASATMSLTAATSCQSCPVAATSCHCKSLGLRSRWYVNWQLKRSEQREARRALHLQHQRSSERL